MSDEKDTQKPEPKPVVEKPEWEGSLSDKPFMAAPDGHDVKKDARRKGRK